MSPRNPRKNRKVINFSKQKGKKTRFKNSTFHTLYKEILSERRDGKSD